MPMGAAVLHLATVAAMVVFLVWLWARASERPLRAAVVTLALLATWLAYVAAMALGGVTTRVDTLPPGGFLVLGPALVAVIIVLVALGRPRFRGVLDAIDAMPLPALLLAQAFRLPVEIVLAMLAEAGLMPRIMTYHGTNFDILTGITAPLAAWAAARGWSQTVLVWNIAGLALVLNVVGTSILAFSGPTNVLKVTPPADYAMTFPMVWLPAFLVPVAMLLHGLAIMKLRLRRQERR
jgi:hypothetical protein